MNEQIPDLVFLTGDYIDNNSGIDILPEILSEIKSKAGIYAVLGNDDHFQYNILHMFYPLFFVNEKKPTDLNKLKKTLGVFGINLLIDEVKEINVQNNKIEIIGIDYLSVKQKKLKNIQIRDNNFFKIVLSHYPDAIKYLRGKVDIMFSGHTHGAGNYIRFAYNGKK